MTDKMNNFLVTGVDGFPIEFQPMLTIAGFSVGSLAEYVKTREQIYRDRIAFLQERIQELERLRASAQQVTPVPPHMPMGPTIPAGAPYGPMDNGVPVRSSQEPAHDRAFSLDNVRELLHAEIKGQWGGTPLPSGEFRRNVAITLLDILSPL